MNITTIHVIPIVNIILDIVYILVMNPNIIPSNTVNVPSAM